MMLNLWDTLYMRKAVYCSSYRYYRILLKTVIELIKLISC
jgi:hypothetical protein